MADPRRGQGGHRLLTSKFCAITPFENETKILAPPPIVRSCHWRWMCIEAGPLVGRNSARWSSGPENPPCPIKGTNHSIIVLQKIDDT